MDSSPDITRLFEIALQRYNSANTPISRDAAARARVLTLQAGITANLANVASVTQPI
jgi:hypothetical protein